MTEERRKQLSRLPMTSYEVGYGKPPSETRFPKGRSGNPRGRPKGSRNRPPQPAQQQERLNAIILEEAYRGVPIHDTGGTTTIPMAKAIVRSLAVNAAKGNQRAQRLFTELLGTTERENQRQKDALLEAAIIYKTEWEQELDRRTRLGIVAPAPLPHPDHVVIDVGTGSVHFAGPVTREEKAVWDLWTGRMKMLEDEREELATLMEAPDRPDRRRLARALAKTNQAIAFIETALGGSRSALRILQRLKGPEFDGR